MSETLQEQSEHQSDEHLTLHEIRWQYLTGEIEW